MPSATVTNTFQTQSGNVPASQIDANFTDLTTFMNVTQAAWITSTVVPGFAATKAAMETSTATGLFVTPSSFVQSPYASKAVATWSGTATGTITPIYEYGLSSIVRDGTGTYSITLDSAHTATAWPAFCTTTSSGTPGGAIIFSQTASSAVIVTFNTTTGTVFDPVFVNFVAYGIRA